MTGGDLLVRCLVAQGVRHVFGIPGALNAGLYDALARQNEIEHLVVRHELGGAWMADGYARSSGDVGVCVTVPGPGATHAASGVAGAYTDCVPVLLLASRPETRWEGQPTRNLFHGLDQISMFSSCTKWCGSVRRGEEIGPAIERAFRELRNGRPGPVVVDVPADILAGPAGGAIPARVEREPAGAEEGAVVQAVSLLASAERPLLLVDDGVLHSGAWEELGELATLLGAPAITTIQGKSSIREDHPWSLGDMNSAAGQAAYPLADVVFAVGSRFAQTDIRWPWFGAPPRLVHLDADPAEVGRLFPAEVGLVGDARRVLQQMLEQLRSTALVEKVGRVGSGWDSHLEELRRLHRGRVRHPLLAALRPVVPEDAVVAYDVCVPGFRSRMDWSITRPRSYFYPGVYVGMGYGLPAAIGARVATGRPTLAICGDGGFQMTMAELATMVQHDLPVVVVVANDSGLTLIRHVQDREYGGRRYATDLINPDFTALARTYGLLAEQVTTPEAAAVAVGRAFAEGVSTLVEWVMPAS